ncbi:MAG: bifunctional diguanylate cyclase/phosphodiesterase [Sphingobium sp.]|nr:bifunctional diguanylate cyclase/phosphodiesterase [Sphingobium sp.]MCP5398286.1 bifunctional diguanylate cyclase/phosphodiesterase [Sphingomonas sp.]
MRVWREIDRHAAKVAAANAGVAAFATGVAFWLSYSLGLGPVAFLLPLLMLFGGLSVLLYRRIKRTHLIVSHVVDRLDSAANGDLGSPVPQAIEGRFPALTAALDGLFRQTRTRIDSANSMALFDAVTGLPNRSNFCGTIEGLIADREIAGPAAMFFIDLDGFKGVNDTLGHAAGDQILARVAARIREVAHGQEKAGVGDILVGRFAGDEFTMFFPFLPPEVSAVQVARLVQNVIREPFIIGGTQVEIGASVGIAYYPEHGATLPALLRSADHAMYVAKSSVSKGVQLYTRDMEMGLAHRAEKERALRHAIERDELRLEFQPQIDFSNGSVICAEALVRWARPGGEVLLPEAFVSLAKETGMIVELGDWIMDKVCDTASRWAASGIGYPVSMNISRRELIQPDFFNRLHATMDRHNVPPHMLELELSESLIMRLSQEKSDALIWLRRKGVRIAIDDFGTGFSNLVRLKDLPVDRVKVDRSLVRDIAISEEARSVCAAVVALVQGVGLDIVIEGVESEDQLEILRVMGCTIFQGFHFSRPVEESHYFERFGANIFPLSTRA